MTKTRTAFWACALALSGYIAGLLQGADAQEKMLVRLLGDTATYSADEWEAVVSYLDQSPFPGAKQVAIVAKTSHRIGQLDGAAKVMADFIEGERQ